MKYVVLLIIIMLRKFMYALNNSTIPVLSYFMPGWFYKKSCYYLENPNFQY